MNGLCILLLCDVLFPFCGSRWLGSEVIEHPRDPWHAGNGLNHVGHNLGGEERGGGRGEGGGRDHANHYKFISCQLTGNGRCFPGVAGIPVMKSDVTKVRITTECWKEGCTECRPEQRSKSIGISTIGI